MKTVIWIHSAGYSIFFRVAPSTVGELMCDILGEDTTQVFHDNTSMINPGWPLEPAVIDKLDDPCYTGMVNITPNLNPPIEPISAEDLLKRWVMADLV